MTLVVCALAAYAHAQPGAQPPTPVPPPPPPSPMQPPAAPPSDATPQHAICFFGRPFECASVILVELGARGDRRNTVTTADVGLIVHDGLNAYGGTIGLVGLDDAVGDVTVLYAARYRRYLGTWGMAADVSVGYAGGPTVEAAIGWGDVIALTVGMNMYELEGGGDNTVASAGLRVGSVTIGGLFYAAALVGTAAR